MKVKTIRQFFDLKEGRLRVKDEEFEVTKERYIQINSTRFGTLVGEIKETKKKK